MLSGLAQNVHYDRCLLIRGRQELKHEFGIGELKKSSDKKRPSQIHVQIGVVILFEI